MGETGLYGRLFRLARPYGVHFAGLLLLGLLASPIALLTPFPLKLVVDSVLGAQPLPRWLHVPLLGNAPPAAAILGFAVALLVAVTLLGQLQSLASTLLRSYVGERLVLDFRSLVIAQIHRLSLSYHDSHGTADSLYRMQEDAPAIQYILADGLVPFVAATFTLVTMLLVTARLDRELALVALVVCPPLFVLSRVYRPRLRRQSRRVKKLESSALGMVQETLAALRIVKAFGQEAREKDRLLQRLREGMRARIRLALVDGGYGMLIGLVTALGVAAVLLIGVRHVRAGVLTLGQLLLVLGYLGQLYDPLKTMSRKVSGMQSYLASAERVFALLDERPGVPERADARPLGRATGAVEFRGVSFAYGPSRPVLHDVRFSVPPGTRLGIAGASGAGKTTLISLLTRFYDPTAGQILLDGLDLRDYQLADLRRQFAVVPQEPMLFLTSVGENIAYAKPGASHEEIVMAARAANAHEFIIRLPQGYDTQVGDRGVQLSGGQRQRIAIARAFLKDSPVLILDEPTSAIDAEAEAAIHGAIRRLMRGRTVILITHRPSMLERCTALIVLENGRVVSDSTRSRPAPEPRPLAAPADRERASNLKSHPAVQAWCLLHPDSEPLRIEPLRLGVKNRIYRLVGAGRAGAAVIAKQCRRDTARVERTVYEELLPHLGIPTLRHYGYLEEPASEQAWLFMEEAIGSEYSKLLVEHRTKAARWLGLLHTSAADARAEERLPDAGPARYLSVLRSAQGLLRGHLDNPVLSSADVEFLQGICSRLDDVAAHWARLEGVCGAVPQTLVHGDFNGKNIRLRSVHGDTALVVFDWENAGWGVPAVDLAQQAVPSGRLSANPDLATYWSTVRERWPEGSADAWQRVAHCGTVFRALSSLTWDAQNLATDWAHAFVGGMQMVVDELEGALERLDWVPSVALPRHEVLTP